MKHFRSSAHIANNHSAYIDSASTNVQLYGANGDVTSTNKDCVVFHVIINSCDTQEDGSRLIQRIIRSMR
jgi:hypothetical protein